MRTTDEVAVRLGLARRTVQKWCAVLAFKRTGRDYLLTDEQIDQILAVAQTKRGRPKGKKADDLKSRYKWLS